MSVKTPDSHDSESVRTAYERLFDVSLDELEGRSPIEVAAAIEYLRRDVVSRVSENADLPTSTVLLAVDDLVDELEKQEGES